MGPKILLSLARPTPDRVASNRNYRVALERAHAEVVEVYPGDEFPTRFHGLLLAGGGDIDPSRYGDDNTASTNIDAERDELELALARQAIGADLPVLGICRGFQLLNVALGGRIIQDVPGHRPRSAATVVHHQDVRPRPDSRLAAAVGSGPISVNSRHHQAVTERVLAPGVAVTVRIGGVIEAFEMADRRWVVAVQWHPERTAEVSPEATRIFDVFVRQAAAAAAQIPRLSRPSGPR